MWPATPAPASAQTKQGQQVKPAARTEGRSAAVLVRLSAKGGTPRLYRLPTLAELPGTLRGRLPAVDRVIGTTRNLREAANPPDPRVELIAFDGTTASPALITCIEESDALLFYSGRFHRLATLDEVPA